MRRLAWIVLALMGAAILLLFLNLREVDRYEHGNVLETSLSDRVSPPVDPYDTYHASLVPDRYTHGCGTCGECAHPVEVTDSRRDFVLIDHDGWFRLFWGLDDVYVFEDLIHMAEAVRNPTAGEASGHLALTLKPAAASHPPASPHECPEVVEELTLVYVLRTSSEPVDRALFQEGDLPLEILSRAPILSHRYDDAPHRPPVIYYYWKLANLPGREAARMIPCACSRP